MKNIESSQNYIKEYHKIIKNNPSLIPKISKVLRFLSLDPNHPSLRLHKVGGKDIYSVSVTMSIRMIVLFRSSSIILLAIRPHDSAYRF
ncbi:plasmid stabilization protein [Candidatus Collierbacteria bacterium CG09_land_8_20_14_0_10_46_12]|uniref:Plasmid stabilization protein n=1 Tax=Candidatus Collierbacteria bacterium CG09_land_8_20_14_0_10_46_12 TaxID=1974533 RepID=A0A2H0WZI5_9BACT|nr:MAG: plasmid stabilization protein [Candidatus Collierbacteria bacterium CG09_land_8_20_14_0_10_46_12]